MSDRTDLRWYKIGADPTQAWTKHYISPPVHAGLSVGDIDGDGHLDIVRTDRWFRNHDGNALRWEVNYIGPNTMPPLDFQPSCAFDGTISQVRDVHGDGTADIVFVDAEIPGGSVWWMENVEGMASSGPVTISSIPRSPEGHIAALSTASSSLIWMATETSMW